jgi:Erythromycin esterase
MKSANCSLERPDGKPGMNNANLVPEIAQRLTGNANDYDALISRIGDARFILIGEASHGTHEFYFDRAQLTKRLIAEKGFTVVAIEADWPDAYRVHRYIRGDGADRDAKEALSGFRRFPTWMWRNTVVVEFVEWLREFNANRDPKRALAGFYGMDLYSLHASIDAVLNYLNKVDPDAAKRARRRYSCFDHFSRSHRNMAMPLLLELSSRARTKSWPSLLKSNGRRQNSCRATDRPRPMSFFSRSRMRGSSRMRNNIIAQCFEGVLHHGTCATATWSKRSTRWWRILTEAANRRRWCGAQLAFG